MHLVFDEVATLPLFMGAHAIQYLIQFRRSEIVLILNCNSGRKKKTQKENNQQKLHL
jgi:hypothetical protein